MDKRGNPVNDQGWRVDDDDNLIDNNGHKKLDKAILTPDGDIPKLLNYDGKPFDIKDVIGQVPKDYQGNMIKQPNRNG